MFALSHCANLLLLIIAQAKCAKNKRGTNLYGNKAIEYNLIDVSGQPKNIDKDFKVLVFVH